MISFLIIPFLGNGEDLEPFSSPALLCVTSGPGKRSTEVHFARWDGDFCLQPACQGVGLRDGLCHLANLPSLKGNEYRVWLVCSS